MVIVDKDTITEIKNSVNIVDVIGEVVSLSRNGQSYLGLCPFHKEKTPSFNVMENRQFYHCFGCGKSGDVFKFLEDYRNISFLESVKEVADRAGIPLQMETPAQQARREHPHQKLFDMNQEASNFYHAVLMTTKLGEQARRYLYERGLTDEILETFHVGLSPNEADYLYQALSKKFDVEQDVFLDSGLFNLTDSNRIYDAFRNRIMFPLTNEFGQVIGFSGRIWTEQDADSKQAKYKNTRSTQIFNKSYELFHLDKAKPVIAKTHEVYLMEGFMDVIAAHRAGIENAVASMGTALTPEHVNHLKKITQKVILTYDGDAAGQHAIAKSLDLLQGLAVDIVRIPGGMDPDEFLKANSKEDLVNLLMQSRISHVEFWIDYLKPDNIDNLQAEIAYVERISKIIVQTPSITAQNSYINKVADLLPDFDYFQIEQSVNNERLRQRGNQGEQRKNDAQSYQPMVLELPVTQQLTAMNKAENQLFHRLLHHPYLLNEYRHRQDFYFYTDELQALYELLKKNGELNAYDLSQLDEKLQAAYYRVLEENLPEDVTDGEMEQIERQRERYLQQQEIRKQSKLIRDSSNQGDVDTAVDALAALIEQKRKME